jgi:multimeric flavodoxin WrbA
MYVLGLNGSPRKTWNTATLLRHAMEGAASRGAQAEIVHLYDLTYKGCVSCFACKLKEGPSYGRCALRDDLTPVLDKIERADAVFIGSPIYLGNVTGETRSLMERMIFQYLVYDEEGSSLVKKKKPVGLLYTMNIKENIVKEWGYDRTFASIEKLFIRVFGAAETMYATDTYQFDDYSKYVAPRFNETEKAKHRDEVFPKNCEKAFALGARFAARE